MPEQPITRADLAVVVTDLKTYIAERYESHEERSTYRIEGINKRLDVLNGSVARHELAIGEERTATMRTSDRLKTIEDALWRRRDERAAFEAGQTTARANFETQQAMPVVSDDGRPALTKGDVKRSFAVVVALATMAAALSKVWEAVHLWLATR